MIGDALSRIQNLIGGVLQGSVLGPILFCIYTIGLSHILAQFYLTFNNVDDTAQKLRDIKEWMEIKPLKLNDECMIVEIKVFLEGLKTF